MGDNGIGDRNRTHGLSRTAMYRRYWGMRNRCHNPKHIGFKNYGAKGVVVCQRWRDSFADFMADMGPLPSAKQAIAHTQQLQGA